MAQKDSQEIFREAEALVSRVKEQLNQTDEFFRSQGLDPDKARDVIAKNTGEKETAEAQAQFAADMEAIDREVAEEAARASFATPARASTGKKPRFMV
jgi:phage gp29-like protein